MRRLGLEARGFPFLLGRGINRRSILPNTTNIPMAPGMTVNLEASNHERAGRTVQGEYTCAVTDKGMSI